MTLFDAPNWKAIAVPDVPLAESFVRGVAVYLALIVLFRVAMRRQAGALGLPDVMLVVLVSECVSQSLSATAQSVPNGLVAVLALLASNYGLDRLANRWPWLHRRLEPPPRDLIRDGRPVRENLDAEGVSDEELATQLRLNGVGDMAGVARAVMEPEGEISVVPKDAAEGGAKGGDTAQSPTLPEPQANRDAAPPDVDAALARFLTAAEGLRAAVAWHDGRAAAHRATSAAAREALSRHGVRPGRAVRPQSADPTTKLGQPQCLSQTGKGTNRSR